MAACLLRKSGFAAIFSRDCFRLVKVNRRKKEDESVEERANEIALLGQQTWLLRQLKSVKLIKACKTTLEFEELERKKTDNLASREKLGQYTRFKSQVYRTKWRM